MKSWIVSAVGISMLAGAGCAEEEGKVEEKYSLRVTTDGRLEAGAAERLSFEIRDAEGQPVGPVDVVHEKRFHILVMPPELDFFAHLHGDEGDPAQQEAADPNEVPSVEVTFPRGGEYRVFIEFQPTGESHSHLVSATVEVAGDGTPENVLASDESGATRTVGSHAVQLENHDGHIVLQVETDGEPAVLEPYLGAAAHLVVAKEGARELVHVHPTGDGADGTVEFQAAFPGGGRYRAFAQMRPDGELITVPFTLHVADKPDGGGGHGH
ncbi:hypothetical protein [Vulgatibacter sp.]|uniref:hypothetical protein n=1 Tax=Vulgatibacter sp. TaxID=1971226 RepID=UPI003565544F